MESERKGIFTLNEEDLYDYKTKFVSECKSELSTCRQLPDASDPTISIMGTVRGYFHGKQNRRWP